MNRHIPWGYSHKPWYGDQLNTKISCIFNTADDEPFVYLDPNLLSLIRGKRIALIDDVISSGGTMSAMLEFLTGAEVAGGEVMGRDVTNGLVKIEEVADGKAMDGKKKGGMGLNIVCVGVGMLQGEKYKTKLKPEVLEMVVGAVESPLLKAVEGGWVQR
ncbi:hypothetical protein NHQ30_005785 [Ciborinia camelliae]|nr:hypothetical protein NHQ30_005785 [Ciborinia camelliae]